MLALAGCTSSKATPSHAVASDAGADAATTLDGAAPACPLVQTADGPVEPGPLTTVCSYKGIPYAAPPTGALRWKPPQPAAAWTTPRPSQAASGCPQVSSVFGTPSSDEDCLYLNVWTPPDRASSPAPVMVFVHGGSFLYGSGTFPLYDGTNLARASGHVVVTLNYRLGALGYLSNAALRAEDPSNPTSGEYGTLDQIAAFTWVQKNVAAFGGDPSNVTIFGESAGATSMALHLVSPKSAGLFKNVIAESIAAIDGSPAATMALGDTNGATFASALGCTDAASLLTCLRAQPVSALLAPGGSSASVAFWPVADGVVIPSDPMALFSAGTFTKVPTVLGNNKNEGTLFVMNDPPTDDASYLAYANQLVPGQGAAIVAQYPIASYGGSYEAAAAAALNDGGFLCPTRKIARAVVATSTPVYRYDFVHVMEDPPFPNLGSFHGSELPFVFGNPIEGVFTLEADEEPLSTLMMSYWANMAAAGNPNGAGLFAWPAYQATTEPEVVLETTPSTETELAQATCDFWDGIED